MPAKRSIMIDILQKNLDPTKEHRSLGRDGRLSSKDVVDHVVEVHDMVIPQLEPPALEVVEVNEVKELDLVPGVYQLPEMDVHVNVIEDLVKQDIINIDENHQEDEPLKAPQKKQKKNKLIKDIS